MKKFTHLHVHSEYSMLDGLNKLAPLVKQAKEFKQDSLAITDHGGMYGALHFYNECKKNEIKPIVGVEAYMAKNSRFDKQVKMGSDQFHITLLAENADGYRNLMKLISIAHQEGFSYKPRIDKDLLFENSKSVIATSGCMNSIFNRLLQDKKKDEALSWFKEFKEVFKDRFFIELQRHPNIPELDLLNKELLEISRSLDIPVIATNDVHYLTQEDAEAQDALLCVQTRKLIADTKRMSMMDSPDFYLKSTQEMVELYHDLPEAIDNTQLIAERCNVEIQTGQLIFPKYPLPKGFTEDSFFEDMSWKKFKAKFPHADTKMEERLKYEMEIIKGKGYSTYFLITQDFVNWAKGQGIAVGPGRGSAAGSLVSYCLGITTINPLIHGLPFERFLNPQRPTPPDIDLDFADNRRDEVIKYVSSKYGSDHVAHVITFGRMEARVSVRDIGRVLGMPYEDPDKIAKLIPNNPQSKTSLSEAVSTVPELTEYYKQPKFKKLIDLAKKVEGVIRHSSVHAAAVIVADKPLWNYTPTQIDSKSGKMITQYDMYALDCNVSDDAIGLLKFDFLGLRNLSIIQTALELIKANKGVELNISELPLDDKETFELLSRGDTFGVFQLESAGMRRVAKTLKPNQFSDIAALVALYRPGPMDLIPTFIEGKHAPDKIEYPHPTLKEVLEETYGVMVYQEQVMQMANIMAGYTLGEADILRRAIGKKKKKLLDENKRIFIQNSIDRGYKKEVAQKVWGFIEAFANYGFNKAHAASYAMISYQTAYLKAHYPVEYMAALMSVESGSHSMNRDVKVAQAIESCKQMGIMVLPPDINSSSSDFTLEKNQKSLEKTAIRFGFNAIKNVGTAAIENILETKAANERFGSLTQFIHQSDSRKVNKKVLESLIKVGAMDQFGTRASMLENLESIKDAANQFESEVDGQDNLFAGVQESSMRMQDTFPSLPEYPSQELLSFEKELLGLYLTDHPMADELKQVNSKATKTISELDKTLHQDQTFWFGGIITSMRKVITKKSGKPMAFGQFNDGSDEVEFVIFPKAYEEFQQLIEVDRVVLFKAKVDYGEDDEAKLIVEKVKSPRSLPKAKDDVTADHEIFIPRKTNKETLEKLGEMLKSNPGKNSIVILIPNGTKPKKLLLPYKVKWDKGLSEQVNSLLA